MKRLLLLGLVLAGCAGSIPQNPFTGSYKGSWNAPTLPDTGTLYFVVQGSGTVVGTVHEFNAGKDGTLTGKLDETGTFEGRFTYGSDFDTLSGKLTRNGGSLSGTLTMDGPGSGVPLRFDLN